MPKCRKNQRSNKLPNPILDQKKFNLLYNAKSNNHSKKKLQKKLNLKMQWLVLQNKKLSSLCKRPKEMKL